MIAEVGQRAVHDLQFRRLTHFSASLRRYDIGLHYLTSGQRLRGPIQCDCYHLQIVTLTLALHRPHRLRQPDCLVQKQKPDLFSIRA
jgi:hypothetical protein